MTADREGEKVTSSRPSKLVGWLVSYQDNQRGSYYELRQGRSFVANGVVSGERVIPLNDSSVSNLHSVINAKASDHIEIQDVFTDSGTFVCRSGSKEEVAVHGPVQIGHGDWVRFGTQAKYQLCLIDGCSK